MGPQGRGAIAKKTANYWESRSGGDGLNVKISKEACQGREVLKELSSTCFDKGKGGRKTVVQLKKT